jgi:hypothetical protein
MISTEDAAGVMFALTAVLILVDIVAVHRIYESTCRSMIGRWAESEDFTLVKLERRRLFARGPFWWGLFQYQGVYRVAAVDRAGHERTGWVRCGNFFVSLLIDEVEARWDADNPAVPSKSGASSAKPAANPVWDRELDA